MDGIICWGLVVLLTVAIFTHNTVLFFLTMGAMLWMGLGVMIQLYNQYKREQRKA